MRITKVLNALFEYWTRNPDLRLGQIVVNMTPRRFEGAPFFVEDDEMLEAIEKANNEKRVDQA